jgi:heme exporter protein D
MSVVTALAFTVMSFGAASFAQTVTPLTCSVANATVNTNQAAVFTAVGGNGSYVWSGPNLSITNASGNQFAVSYPNPGVYSITVTSAGQTASCNMTVVAAAAGALTCSPATQNVTLGQTATFSATGGSGTYTWSSPDLTITNATGSGFSANYASTGLKTMTVSSGGVSDTCDVNVLAGTVTPPPVVTPGLPNTGGGYGR